MSDSLPATASSVEQVGTGYPRNHGAEDLGFLWDFWYPAVRSSEIRGRNLVTAMLLEIPLVLGRTDEGRAFAMRDSCPHRGIPLSYGRFDGKAVECSYHGWKFEACTGRCVEIPSLTSQDKLKVERIFSGHYPCEERDGYVWVYMTARNSPRLAEAPMAAPALPVFSDKYKITRLSCEIPSHVDQGIIGLMDPAHGPFVHQSWYWRSAHKLRDKQKTFEPIPNGFRMVPHAPSANSTAYKILGVYGQPVTTTIDFELPNQRTETIRCGKWWFIDRTVVTPIRPPATPLAVRSPYLSTWLRADTLPGNWPTFWAGAEKLCAA